MRSNAYVWDWKTTWAFCQRIIPCPDTREWQGINLPKTYLQFEKCPVYVDPVYTKAIRKLIKQTKIYYISEFY